MFRTPDHTLPLPAGFLVLENEDVVRVDCAACGHEATYTARHVDPLVVELDAWAHLSVCRPGARAGTGDA